MAAFPALIMWKTPMHGMDFLCEQKEEEEVRPGLDHRKGLGPSWSYRQYCCAVPPCESNLWPAEDAVSSRMVSFACWSLLFIGWTFTCLITSKQDINSTTWMNQPHQHVHFYRIFTDFISNNENGTRINIITPAHRLWPNSQGWTTPNVNSAILYVEPLKKKTFLVEFVLWLAIRKVQS